MNPKQNLPLVISEIIVSYQPAVKLSLLPVVTCPIAIYQLFLEHWDQSKLEYVEELKVMLLNQSNKVLGIRTVTSGSATGTVTDPKQVFSIALKANATQIILAHNHPSGNAMPSRVDQDLTERMRVAGEILQLKLVDHIIITREQYYSFAEEGAL